MHFGRWRRCRRFRFETGPCRHPSRGRRDCQLAGTQWDLGKFWKNSCAEWGEMLGTLRFFERAVLPPTKTNTVECPGTR